MSSKFLKGAFTLAVAGIVCRVLGVIFRIPLTNIVGNFGMGLYQMVFPLYALLLIVSSAGVPVAISKMIAREEADGKKVLFNALILLGVIGLFLSAVFTIFSYNIAALQGHKSAGMIYIAIAPSVFLVCIISAFRGYFQGLQNMIPTAVSQIIEQLVKMAAGITLALVLIGRGVEWAVFGAILAVTISEIVALGFLFIAYFWKKAAAPQAAEKQKAVQIPSAEKQATAQDSGGEVKKQKFSFRKMFDKKIMLNILKQSLPITAMQSIFPLILVFDSMVIINLLKAAGRTGEEATQLFGIQSGTVHTLINMPAVIGVALATAVVPAISALLKQNKQKEMRTHAALAIKLAVLVSLFFVVFYLLFSDRVIDFLYHNAFRDNKSHFKIATNLLRIESIGVLLMGLSMVFSAMLQATDRSKLPLISLAIGGGAKLAFELVFITTKMGVYAVSISNIICFSLAAVLNTIFALRRFKIKGKFIRVALKVTALTLGYFAALFGLNLIVPGGRWWLVLIASAGTAVYGGLILCLKLFDSSEQKVFNSLRKSE